MANIAQLQEIVESAVKSLDLELWALEYSGGGKQALLRIYIDSDKGISVENCAAVSRQVGAVMDVEDPINGEYTLEVSSPGAARGLYKTAHYEKYVGYEVTVKLRYPLDGQRNFKGILTGVENEEIILRIDDEEFLFPVEEIDKANVIPNWE